MTSSRVMMTSWCSLPRYSAVCRAYFRSKVFGGLPGVLQVDGVGVHPDGKGADGPAQSAGRDGADQGGVQPAREEEADRRVGVQPLFHPGDQLFADIPQHLVHPVGVGRGDVGHVLVADKAPVAVVAADGKGANLLAPAHQVLQFAGKGDLMAGFRVAVKQRPDANGVPRGDQPVLAGVVEDQGELGVQMPEHIQPVLVVEGQQNLAVAARAELVALPLEDGLFKAEAVQLPVADHAVRPAGKGLHPIRRQPHDGQPPKAHQPERPFNDPLVVRTAADGPQQVVPECGGGQIVPGITHNTAHSVYSLLFPIPSETEKEARHPLGGNRTSLSRVLFILCRKPKMSSNFWND